MKALKSNFLPKLLFLLIFFASLFFLASTLLFLSPSLSHNIATADTTAPCSDSNPTGSCTSGETCQALATGGNSCQTAPCSDTDPTGYCPSGEICQALATGGNSCQTATIPVVIGNSATCIPRLQPCAEGGVDANGKTCCSGLSCQSTVDESTHTYESMCDNIPKAPPVFSCSGSSCSTALGDIPINVGGFVNKLFAVILSISGGIAILLIIISGYKLMVSRGNPEQIQGAREQFTAAIVGLLFIILSLVILQVIGVDILKLPGFNP